MLLHVTNINTDMNMFVANNFLSKQNSFRSFGQKCPAIVIDIDRKWKIEKHKHTFTELPNLFDTFTNDEFQNAPILLLNCRNFYK